MAIEKIVKRTTFAEADKADREYWMSRTPTQRVEALTAMVNAVLEGMDESSRQVQRVCRVLRRPER